MLGRVYKVPGGGLCHYGLIDVVFRSSTNIKIMGDSWWGIMIWLSFTFLSTPVSSSLWWEGDIRASGTKSYSPLEICAIDKVTSLFRSLGHLVGQGRFLFCRIVIPAS